MADKKDVTMEEKKATGIDVWWIRLDARIFDDMKIKIIRQKPLGLEMIVIWVHLLCLAAQTNDGGYITVAEKLVTTPELLSSVMNFPSDTIRIALNTFEALGMIELIDDGDIYINNWAKWQYTDGMEKIRLQNAERQRRFRNKKKNEELPEPEEEPTGRIPYAKIVDLYKELCPELPQPRGMSEKRKKLIKARYKEHGEHVEVFKEIFEKAGKSEFLAGKNDRGWTASLDWMLEQNNFIKVLEGRYDNRGGDHNDNDTTSTGYSGYASLH